MPAATADPTATATGSLPGAVGLRMLWQSPRGLRPVAVAPSQDRIAVLAADGRFAWLAMASGQQTASVPLWPSIDGETQGEVHTDGGRLAVVAARQRRVDAESGRVRWRARLSVFDVSAGELWSLPELTSGHAYSVVLAADAVVVGTWPRGARAAPLAAYDPISGEELWRVTDWRELSGVRLALASGARVYALIDTAAGRGVASFDAATGEELWRWSPVEGGAPEQLSLDGDVLFALGAAHLWAIDAATGEPRGSKAVAAEPGAGFVAREGALTLAPAPSAEQGFLPGLVSLSAQTGGTLWHGLDGVLAEAFTARDGALWVVSKDFDEQRVALHTLDRRTGTERARLDIAGSTEPGYAVAAHATGVYVLGERLWAFDN